MKTTKRQGFNFLASYKEVYLMLPTSEEKAKFIDMLLDKQFNNIEPSFEDVTPFVKMAYISQKHSLDKSVKGFEDKTKIKLQPLEATLEAKKEEVKPPLEATFQQEKEKEEVQEEEKEQVQEQEEFLKIVCDFFSQTNEVLEMRVNSVLRDFVNKKKYAVFKKQTLAYIDYKKIREEKIHSWSSYQAEWDKQDWVDKLKKLKNIKVKTETVVHSNR